MSAIGPGGGLMAIGACALLVAFASSTQDIVVDAWRIEVADNNNELGLLSSAYQLGYRGALLVTDALILIAANHLGWPISYTLMAALMGVGFYATWKATEPPRRRSDGRQGNRAAALHLARLFRRGGGPVRHVLPHPSLARTLMLAVISLYQIPNFVSGPMSNTFYHDIGLSKDAVGGIRASVGLVFSLLGIAAGGIAPRVSVICAPWSQASCWKRWRSRRSFRWPIRAAI